MIAVLADVGAAMEKPVTFQQRYVQSTAEGGVVADRCVHTFEAAIQLLGAWLSGSATPLHQQPSLMRLDSRVRYGVSDARCATAS